MILSSLTASDRAAYLTKNNQEWCKLLINKRSPCFQRGWVLRNNIAVDLLGRTPPPTFLSWFTNRKTLHQRCNALHDKDLRWRVLMKPCERYWWAIERFRWSMWKVDGIAPFTNSSNHFFVSVSGLLTTVSGLLSSVGGLVTTVSDLLIGITHRVNAKTCDVMLTSSIVHLTSSIIYLTSSILHPTLHHILLCHCVLAVWWRVLLHINLSFIML